MADNEIKVLKSELGVSLSQDSEGRYYLSLNGLQMFNGGLPPFLEKAVYKSYDNLIRIRTEEQQKRDKK